jgi:hypothetical protein
MAADAPKPVSQVQWLGRDLYVIRAAIEADPARFRPLVDVSDPQSQNFHSVVASLFWRAYDHAAGAQQLLAAGLRTPLLVVQRALLECTIAAEYLAEHQSSHVEAAIYRACSILREIELVPLDEAALQERQRILAAMLPALVEEASRRKKGWGWSGRSFKKMAELTGFSSYEVYEYLSEFAHARIGEQVQLVPMADGRRAVRFGQDFDALELEYAANFARRMLFRALHALRTAFNWETIDLATSDPEAWFRHMESEYHA